MKREPGSKTDGLISCLGGIDTGRHPSLLEPNVLSFGVNISLRGGYPKTRPRVSRKALVFENEDDQLLFESYPLQGYTRTAYRPDADKSLIVVSIGGRIFAISPQDDFAVTDITPDSGNIPTLPLAWMEQAEQYLIIQNDKDLPIIYDGANARRAMPGEVPVGSAMAYNEEIGRLCVAVNQYEIAIGDIAGGPTGVLKFAENVYFLGGGKFRVPRKYGPIKAMSMLANLDRSNGQGPLIVFADEGLSTFNLPPNRDLWPTLTYPPQVNMPIRYSAQGQNSVVLVNGDLYYQSKDGLRSFLYALRDFQQPGNVPISSEMDRITSRNDQQLLKHSAGILFDNRLVFTVSPAPSTNGIYHRGMGALDFNLISRLGQKSPPVYDCVWAGIRPTGMMTGTFEEEERAFIFALNDGGENELWELHRESGYDNEDTRVQSALETRAFNFGNPFTINKLQGLEVWVDEVKGTVNMGAQFRSDAYPCWTSFCAEKEFCAQDEECNEDGELSCVALQSFNPGYSPRLNFGQPPDDCDTVGRKPLRMAYEVQFRLYWTGHCRIRRILAKAQDVTEEIYPPV